MTIEYMLLSSYDDENYVIILAWHMCIVILFLNGDGGEPKAQPTAVISCEDKKCTL